MATQEEQLQQEVDQFNQLDQTIKTAEEQLEAAKAERLVRSGRIGILQEQLQEASELETPKEEPSPA